MKIYLSGAIRGGRELAATYQIIHDFLIKNGHTVLAEHVAHKDVLEIEASMSELDIYTQDIEWLTECHAIVAEISIPSTGVGYEIAYSLHTLKKPVLALYEEHRKVSAMIVGNTSKNLKCQSYNGKEDLISKITIFLGSINSK
ncbi:MAG: nucleoside 2-deoxyribosyltransferase [Candidatus Hodarchaeales archaeon]